MVPITNAHKEQFDKTIEYIAAQVLKLGEVVLERSMPIDTVTIFTRSREEFDLFDREIRKYGPVSNLSHGKTLYIEPRGLRIKNQKIKYLGIRQPDKNRPEVGYGDFPVEDLNRYANNKFVASLRSGTGRPMLEIRHPDFDVRGYIVVR